MAKGAALITGASSGIGAELARLCAGDGYAVILVARRADRLAELAENLVRECGVAARVIAADLADAGAVVALHDQTRGDNVEILINNAGFGLRGAYTETDWEAESRLIQVNMIAVAHLTKLFAKDMLHARFRAHPQRRFDSGFRSGPVHGDVLCQQGFRGLLVTGDRQRVTGHRGERNGIMSRPHADGVRSSSRDG